MTTTSPSWRSAARRRLLGSLAGVGTTTVIDGGLRAQEATPEPTWSPPPIPQPLPESQGTPPPIVGARQAEAPVSGAPTSVEQPSAAGTPGVGQATPGVTGEDPVSNPQQPAQPIATPVTQDDDEVAAAATVVVTPEFRFDPQEVRIRVGEAVEWRNEGRSPQTVTGDPGWAGQEGLVQLPEGAEPWDAGIINYGESVTHIFEVPGEYTYVSLPQAANGMTGRVIVEP
jgi:plastocyanin